MAVVPYTFANQAGQIPLSELDVNFANVKAFAETAGNVTGNIQANITAVGTLTALSVTGNIVATRLVGSVVGNVSGNISGNLIVAGANTQVLFNDNGLANAAAGMTFNKTLNTLAVTGTITGGNIVTGGAISSTGNITGGNIIGTIVGTVSTTSVSATGNIDGGNLRTAGSISAAGNISLSGNLIANGNTVLSGNATASTAANGTNSTQIATTAFVANTITNSAIPAGIITLWFGSIATIPAGWALCNGGNGTPDLRNRFIVGAGSTYAVNAIGGSANATVVNHTHSATSVVSDPGHNHSYTAPSGTDNGGISGSSVVDSTVSASTGTANTGITVTTTVASAGSSGTDANLPPYYALAYIMKL